MTVVSIFHGFSFFVCVQQIHDSLDRLIRAAPPDLPVSHSAYSEFLDFLVSSAHVDPLSIRSELVTVVNSPYCPSPPSLTAVSQSVKDETVTQLAKKLLYAAAVPLDTTPPH